MRGQHYTRNTVAISKYCPTCNRMTMHRVDDRRAGCCLETHIKGIDRKQEKVKTKTITENLF